MRTASRIGARALVLSASRSSLIDWLSVASQTVTSPQTASSFQSDVTIEKDGETVSAKSIMALLTLESPRGTRLRVRASGPAAAAALDAMQELFDAKFYED